MGPGALALQSSGAFPRQRRRVELTLQGCSGPPARGKDFPGRRTSQVEGEIFPGLPGL